MEAHQVRSSRWSNSYHLKRINMKLSGYSRAAFRTGFYIPELDIMLDAGPQNFNHPSHIFITHSHGDHVAELPFTFFETEPTEENKTQLYGPPGSKQFVVNYIQSTFEMNAMKKKLPGEGSFYDYTEVIPDLTNLHLNLKNNQILIKVIKCDHSVPTVSYLFRIIKKKIKDEYRNLSGKEIVELKNKNIEITKEVKQPLFAYICDCSIKTIEQHSLLLTDYPYVIVECTFLYEDDLQNAIDTQHIHWDQLKTYIKQHPNTTWILIHFSLRYKDEDIRTFFEEKYQEYPNIHPWISSNTTNSTLTKF